MAARLQARFADDQGRHPTHDEVQEIIRVTALEFADARLEEYAPLLIEHMASDVLRSRGLHAVVPR